MTSTTRLGGAVLVAALCAVVLGAQQSDAVPFAAGVISTPQSICVTFAPGGGEAYFARSEPGAGKSSIMVSRLVDGRWTTPQVAPFSGTYSDGDPAMAPDGSRLVFWSWRPLAGDAAPAPASSLWQVERRGESWGAPRSIGADERGGGAPVYAWGPSVAAGGTLYFFRGGPKAGGPPWVSRAYLKGGRFLGAEYLDESLNGAFGGGDTGIAPDERFIVFSSSRPDSLGAGDLYVSFRQGARWTEPRNLGPRVNSAENEFCPSVFGRELYFSRSGRGILSIPLEAVGLAPVPR